MARAPRRQPASRPRPRAGSRRTQARPAARTTRPSALPLVNALVQRAPAVSAEVGLHELGESIAATVVSVQGELSRYPNSLGAYLLDEVELTIPLQMRVDDLGQPLVVVASSETSGPTTTVRMRVRPVLGASSVPADGHQPLEQLALSADVIAKLQDRRVFSVEDLQRVARDPAGQVALARLGLGVPIERVVARADLLTLREIPPQIATALLQSDIESADAFAKADATKLAPILSRRTGQDIGVEDVQAWQAHVGKSLEIPLPTRPARPGRPGGPVVVIGPTRPGEPTVAGPVVVTPSRPGPERTGVRGPKRARRG